MPLPYTFLSGDTARSAEVNANFNYLLNVLGDLVGPDRISTLKEFLMGNNSQVLFSATSQHYFQLGWNADYNHLGGGVFKYTRFVANKNATALRIGKDGAEFIMTSATSGDLDKQMNTPWALRATTGDDYMFFAPTWSMQTKDGTATLLSDYRLTFVPFQTSKVVYTDKQLNDATAVTFSGYEDQGIPKNAKAVKLTVHILAGAGDAQARFFPAGVTRNLTNGITIAAASGKVGAGSFDLNLGTGSNKNKYVLQVVGPIAKANVAVLGYWI